MKRAGIVQWIGIVAVGVVGWAVVAPHAQAAGVAAPPAQAGGSSDVATLLAPVLAAATGIERIIEMAWSWFESAAEQTVAALGLGSGWAGYARGQVQAAESALNTLAGEAALLTRQTAANPAPSAAAADLATRIDAAQQRLLDAQQQLRTALKSDRYVSIKQAVSVLVSLGLGLVIAGATGLDMFHLLGLTSTSTIFGGFITGLVIGAGSGPVHSIIGLLQQSRDAVDQAANLFSSRARENATQALSNVVSMNAAAAAPGPAAVSRDFVAAPAPPAGMLATPEQVRMIERLATR